MNKMNIVFRSVPFRRMNKRCFMSTTSKSTTRSTSRALALSVHFCHPDLGMMDYEILTRGSAFLLAVDPPEPEEEEDDDEHYKYLEDIREARRSKLKKQSDYQHDPAGGPSRQAQELGWLEFAPTKFRPMVHVVGASHVLAPWLWPDYYPQPWLKSIEQKHCAYTLEVYNTAANNNGDNTATAEAVAKFALNPYALHFPKSEIDLAIIHLKDEEASLKIIEDQGVEVLYLRDDLKHEKPFQQGDTVYFEGYEIMEKDNIINTGTATTNLLDVKEVDELIEKKKKDDDYDDNRVFVSHADTGILLTASEKRFLAKTSLKPLPEGVCGGPTLDEDGRVCGIVEGIVPTTHENTELAGAASFIPSFRIHQFLSQYAERLMLETILPPDLFANVVELKESGELGGDQLSEDSVDRDYRDTIRELYKHHSEEEVRAIRKTITRERNEVLHIMATEGGNMAEVVKRVRSKTLAKQNEAVKRFEKHQAMLQNKVGNDENDENTSVVGARRNETIKKASDETEEEKQKSSK